MGGRRSGRRAWLARRAAKGIHPRSPRQRPITDSARSWLAVSIVQLPSVGPGESGSQPPGAAFMISGKSATSAVADTELYLTASTVASAEPFPDWDKETWLCPTIVSIDINTKPRNRGIMVRYLCTHKGRANHGLGAHFCELSGGREH
jgi:hypothetical protein